MSLIFYELCEAVREFKRHVKISLIIQTFHLETLKNIYCRYESGRVFIEMYKNVDGIKIYPSEARKYIKITLLERVFRIYKGHISHLIYEEIVQTILNELPDEDRRVWYTPHSSTNCAGGLLYGRYCYLKQNDKRYRTDALVHSSKENEPLARSKDDLSSEKMACEGNINNCRILF